MPGKQEKTLHDRIVRAQREYFTPRRLREEFGAYGSAVGRRIVQKRGGERTTELCLRIFVDEKSKNPIPGRTLLKPTQEVPLADGSVIRIPVDVCKMARPRLQGFDFSEMLALQDPAPDLQPGTIGGWAWDETDDTLVFLSNAHVLGKRKGQRVTLGDDSVVGYVKRGRLTGAVDCTVVDPAPTVEFDPHVQDVGPAIFAVSDALEFCGVTKYGRTTHKQYGTIDATNYQFVDVEADITMTDGFAVMPIDAKRGWTEDGDSGGLVFRSAQVMDEDVKEVVGVHWGWHERLGLASDISSVFREMELSSLAFAPFAASLGSLFFAAEDAPPFEFYRTRRPRKPDPLRELRTALGAELLRRIGELAPSLAVIFRRHRVRLLRAIVQQPAVRRTLLNAFRPFLQDAFGPEDVLRKQFSVDDAARLLEAVQVLGATLDMREALRPVEEGLPRVPGLVVRNALLALHDAP